MNREAYNSVPKCIMMQGESSVKEVKQLSFPPMLTHLCLLNFLPGLDWIQHHSFSPLHNQTYETLILCFQHPFHLFFFFFLYRCLFYQQQNNAPKLETPKQSEIKIFPKIGIKGLKSCHRKIYVSFFNVTHK